MRRVFAQHAVVEIATRAGMSAPPAPSAHGKGHGAYHADERYEARCGEEIAHDEIYSQQPVERAASGRKIAMEGLLCHVLGGDWDELMVFCYKNIDFLDFVQMFFSIRI